MRKRKEYVQIKKKEPKKKPKKKAKNRRNTDKFSAIKPELNLKIRRDEIEDVAEYFDKLPLEAKRWMNKFVEEYVNDKLDRDNLKNNLHNTKKLKQSCDARNNSRNKDILSREKASGLINYIEDSREYEREMEQRLEYDELEQVFEFNNSTDKGDDES